MVEGSPPERKGENDENYPLLMVSGNGVDGKREPPAVVTSGVWSVSAAYPRKSWREKWPEIISTCWFILILMGTFCLILNFFVSAPYYHLFLVKWNDTKPASNVYIHNLVPYGNYVPFTIYSKFLSNVAQKYPFLRYHVYFLVDDSAQNEVAKYPAQNSYYRALPFHTFTMQEEFSKRDMMYFQKRHRNVNITVVPLSKYMATTSLKSKWRNIPTLYLPFFARVNSVWENGGIGFDLNLFNNAYNKDQFDHTVAAILREHNSGVRNNAYNDIFSPCINARDDMDMLLPLYDFIEKVLNETKLFFGATDISNLPFMEQPIPNKTNNDKTSTHNTSIRHEASLNKSGLTDKPINSSMKSMTTTNAIKIDSKNVSASEVNDTTVSNLFTLGNNTDIIINEMELFNKLHPPHEGQFIIIYDLSQAKGMPGEGMQRGFDRLQVGAPVVETKKPQFVQQHLSIDPDGLFVSSTSPQHPLLREIVTTGYKRKYPKLAIKEALNSQCFGMYRSPLCDNIFVL